jgi:hypothetical protein
MHGVFVVRQGKMVGKEQIYVRTREQGLIQSGRAGN